MEFSSSGLSLPSVALLDFIFIGSYVLKSPLQKRTCTADHRVYIKMNQEWENGELEGIK
jgi:hypothetical protein